MGCRSSRLCSFRTPRAMANWSTSPASFCRTRRRRPTGRAEPGGASRRAGGLRAPSGGHRRAKCRRGASGGRDRAGRNRLPGRSAPAGPEQRQEFKAAVLKGRATAKLIWLPLSKDRLALCWDVILMSRPRGEMFRVLVDAQTGRGAAAALPDRLPQRRHLPGLYQRQPLAVLARLFDARLDPAAGGGPHLVTLQRPEHQRLAQRLD